MTPLTGAYINLDRSPERRAGMEAQLARLGLTGVRRHAAVDGLQLAPDAGAHLRNVQAGCFLSHLQVLEQADPGGCTLVLEDDVELAAQLPLLVGKLVASGTLEALDIVFLECQPHCSLAHLSSLWDAACRLLLDAEGPQRRTRGLELLDAATFYKWGTSAYLVTPTGRERMLALLRGWQAEGPRLPIDRALEQALQQGRLRGAVAVPFLATTALRWHRQSTVADATTTPPDLLMVLRRLLYAGDVRDAARLLAGVTPPPQDLPLQLFSLLLREVAAVQRIEAQQPPGTPSVL